MSAGKVLAFGAWDRGDGYPRGAALLEGLRGAGVEVEECSFEAPYAGVDKKRLLRSPWLWPSYWWAMRAVRRRASRSLRRAVRDFRPDVVLVLYPGHWTIHWIRRVWGGPVVLDLFLSAYDTAVVDRKMFSPRSLTARLLARLDQRAVGAAQAVLFDTAQNAQHLAAQTRLDAARCHVVPVSTVTEPWEVTPYRAPGSDEVLEVLFFGTGVPLHGLGHLLDALEQCEGVRLTVVGGAAEDRQRAQAMPSHKVCVAGEFLPAEQLRGYIDRAHLVAGVFGTSSKARRVVPLKVMLALSAGRPVITGRTPAITTTLRDGVECVTVPVGDAPSLASALQRLSKAPDELRALAAASRSAYQREFSLRRVGDRLRAVCAALSTEAEVVPAPPATGEGLTPPARDLEASLR